MRLQRLLAGALSLMAIVPPSFAQTSVLVPDAAQIEKAKSTAAGIAGTMRSQSFVLDAQGRPKLDAQGQPILQTNSIGATRDSLRMFQDYTGLAGLEQVASPGNDGKNGTANINMETKYDFKCQPRLTNVGSAAGLSFRLLSCDVTKGLTLQVCDNTTRGGLCTTDTDFKAPVVLAPGAFSNIGDTAFGLGCNSTGDCRITVKRGYTFGGNDSSLKQQAAAASQQAASDKSSALNVLSTTVVSGDYANKVAAVGPGMQACAQKNQGALSNGTFTACDDSQTVAVATPQNNASCSTSARTCLKEASSVQNYTRSCVRTFPITERITHTSFNGTATCTYTRNLIGKVTESCSGSKDGLTKVGQTDEVCSDETADSCRAYSWTEYYANTSNGQVTNVEARPSAVTGACDTNPLSQTRFVACENANWFGRTLDSSSCGIGAYDTDSGAFAGVMYQLNYTQRAGCGFCLTPQVGETCYGAPSETDQTDTCANAAIEGCTLVSATPEQTSGGLVLSQRETYSCKKENKMCVQWSYGSGDSNCLSSNATLGLDKISTGPAMADGSLNDAIVSAAIIDSTGRGIEGAQTQAVPKIFNGTDMRCTRATGGVGQLFGRNCCRTDLERPVKGFLTREGCSLDEAKLAAARRSFYDVRIGDYCSREINGWFFSICLQYTDTYCVFPGILPRIVHQQGRQQLANIAASGGGNVAKSTFNFPYYDSGNGSWGPGVTVNNVRVHAWQWPAYCSDPAKAAQLALTDPSIRECPTVVTTWFAACDNAGGCGDLPNQPSEGAAQWTLHMVDPLVKATSAVSKYSVINGACSTGSQQCSYEVSAWPAGMGGKAVVSRDLSWPLFSNENIGRNNPSAAKYQMNNIGDLMFKGYSVPGMANGTMPATVQLDLSRDGGQTWASYAIPTGNKDQEIHIPDSDVTIFGYCEALTNLCSYRITGTTTVFAKPWGSARHPDCSGFTAGQLAAMDFGKMDLSEWLDNVMGSVKSQSQEALVQAASQEFQTYNSIFAGGAGTVSQSTPRAANFARAVPAEGFGPFNVTLAVSGFWPETTGDPALDNDRVTQVDVDWGDCSNKQTLSAVAPSKGTGFSGTHTFNAPDSFGCLGNPQRNVTHQIKITAYTSKSGVQNRVVTVENAWARFPGGKTNNDNVGGKVTVPASSGAPQSPAAINKQ